MVMKKQDGQLAKNKTVPAEIQQGQLVRVEVNTLFRYRNERSKLYAELHRGLINVQSCRRIHVMPPDPYVVIVVFRPSRVAIGPCPVGIVAPLGPAQTYIGV